METVIKKKVRPEYHIHNLMLGIRSWKKLFTRYEVKLIIAEALNYCVHSKELKLKVKGYLITDQRVYLILKCETGKINHIMFHFFEQVRKEIRSQLQKSRANEFLNFKHDHEYEMEKELTDLFLQFPLLNVPLIKLITGHKFDLPYYDPQLAQLKKEVHNNNFCSAVDYSGGKGPVIINTINEPELVKPKIKN